MKCKSYKRIHVVHCSLLLEEIKLTTNANTCSYLNLKKDNFLWKFVYLSTNFVYKAVHSLLELYSVLV